MAIEQIPNPDTNYLPYLHTLYNLLAPLGSIGLLGLLCWVSFWIIKFKFGKNLITKEEEKNGKSESADSSGHLTDSERTLLHELGIRAGQNDKKILDLETSNSRILSILQQDTTRWDSIILKIGELSGKMESLMSDKNRH